jgi:hypothetical protein
MLIIFLRRSALILAALPLTLCAQGTPAASSAPLPLAGVHYRYWPEQLMQWVGPELPYSLIVLNVDDRGKQPVYDVQLIDKSGKTAIHYTNTAAEFAIDQKAGDTVHQVTMRFDGPAQPLNGAQYMLRFATETGVPVVWQFVLGTDVTAMGSGVMALPTATPFLVYRSLGGLAGQGTALQVGNVTSVAAEYTELAHPPYFVPYRGALSRGIQALSFVPGATSWKADALTLSSTDGVSMQLGRSGDLVTMTDLALGTTAFYETSGASISRIRFGPENSTGENTVRLEFSPALKPGGQSKFEVTVGKKTKIATGTVRVEAEGTDNSSEDWNFTSPDDLRQKSVKASATLQR